MGCSCGCEDKTGAASLLKKGVTVVNFGMEAFYDDLKDQDVKVVQVDWKPSFAGKSLMSKLKRLKKN